MKNLNIVENDGWTRLDTDVLILGSGLAGLLLGILLHDQGAAVTIASKEAFSDSNTFYAQGGVAAVTANNFVDSITDHLHDTIKSGAGLTNEAVAKELIAAAPLLVHELSRLGMGFDQGADGSYELAREGGHSKARVLHSKDTTGKAISTALLENIEHKASSSANFNMLEQCFAFNLLQDGQKVIGAEVLHKGQIKRIYARHTVLATGGAGQIYARTTNPLVATADGVALAYRAGATLADLEFMQFHPTALAKPGAPAFLISEAVRGAGAVLLNGNGEPFVKNFHPDGDLATRDVVARAIHSTMLNGNLSSVGLDLRPIGEQTLLKRFPNIIATCKMFGVDPTHEPVPVCPAAHYFMGGVLSDACGRTSLPGLYAIGEVASTGLHGANRLASNSLLEAGVMAINLAKLLSASANGALSLLTKPCSTLGTKEDQYSVPSSLTSFKQHMYEYASLTRSEAGLTKLSSLMKKDGWQSASFNVANICAANVFLIGELIATAALNRAESRGAHFREDFPKLNDQLYGRRQAVSQGRWHWLDTSSEYAKIDKQSARTA
jgi:L-aspartate oxidase